MCWIVILEAGKAKGMVLKASEGLHTVSPHHGRQAGKSTRWGRAHFDNGLVPKMPAWICLGGQVSGAMNPWLQAPPPDTAALEMKFHETLERKTQIIALSESV